MDIRTLFNEYQLAKENKSDSLEALEDALLEEVNNRQRLFEFDKQSLNRLHMEEDGLTYNFAYVCKSGFDANSIVIK